MSERNIANSRVTELEERIVALEREAAAAKQEATAAIQRAEKAEEKEQAATKQEENLFSRVEAFVNCLTGNFFLFSSHYLVLLFVFCYLITSAL